MVLLLLTINSVLGQPADALAACDRVPRHRSGRVQTSALSLKDSPGCDASARFLSWQAFVRSLLSGRSLLGETDRP
jgi:hypothetical protein